MADFLTTRERSRRMGLIRGRGNKDTEMRLIRVFRTNGIIGWRRGSTLFGKPDFVFQKFKLAVFVDGCFWHGCPKHGLHLRPQYALTQKLSTKASFWLTKIARNQSRDRDVNRLLKKEGWRVMRIWEHDLTVKRSASVIRKIQRALISKGVARVNEHTKRRSSDK